MNTITETMDFVIGLREEEKKCFLQVLTKLAKTFALCATEPGAQELNTDIVKLLLMEGKGQRKLLHKSMRS